jgi:hypothetical protein
MKHPGGLSSQNDRADRDRRADLNRRLGDAFVGGAEEASRQRLARADPPIKGLASLLASLALSVVACGGPGAPLGSRQEPSLSPSVAAPASGTASPSTDAADEFRSQLEAALQLFEGTWYLFCFGADENGNMPKSYAGAVDLGPAIAALRSLDPPGGWLAVANEAKDLADVAETTSLTATIIAAQYRQDQLGYEAANATWREDVLAACTSTSTDAIRAVREHADAIR